jgi:hypothetical protein
MLGGADGVCIDGLAMCLSVARAHRSPNATMLLYVHVDILAGSLSKGAQEIQ